MTGADLSGLDDLDEEGEEIVKNGSTEVLS